MKKLIAVTLLTFVAACGQTTTKHKPAVAAQTGWTKYELKDEITDKATAGFYVSSLLPEKATLLILCRAEGPYVTINPHFQISYDSDGYHTVTIPIRTDDVASEITSTVAGGLDDTVLLGNESKILGSTKVIKIKLFEFGGSYHVMTFKLQGPAPTCPSGAK